MRNHRQIDQMLKVVERVWKEQPDWSLGQLLWCAHQILNIKTNLYCDQVYYRKDNDLIRGLWLLEKRKEEASEKQRSCEG